jgi:hypothetical protein
VSSIAVNKDWKLKDLRTALLSENLWDEKSTVSFFRNDTPAAKQLAFTTKVQNILDGNSDESPLSVVVVLPQQHQVSLVNHYSSVSFLTKHPQQQEIAELREVSFYRALLFVSDHECSPKATR